MVKQLITKKQTGKRTSSRQIKKRRAPSDQQQCFSSSQNNSQNSSNHSEDDSDFEDSSNNQNSQEEESQSTPQIAPQNLAVRNMKFRDKRGTKMNYLITRKKQEEEDPFWAAQGQNYFGNLDDADEDDEEDYVQSSSGRDQFDSDFDQTQSEHEQQQGQQEKQVNEDDQKAKKKRQQLMRKIHAPAPAKKTAQKTNISSSGNKKIDSQKKIVPQTTTRYIHEMFNQQQILGEAATTQYFNWLSLKKLISIQTQKKDFTHRSHHIEGPKIVYRNKLKQDGQNEVTYELHDVQVKNVEKLSKIFHQK